VSLILLFPLVLLAMYAAGCLALKHGGYRFGDPLEAQCFSFVAGYALIAFLATLLGLLSLLYAQVFLILLPLLCLCGVRDILGLLRSVGEGTGHLLRRGAPRLPLLVTVAAALFACGAFLSALAPPTFADVLHYHFAMPRLYADAHGFLPLPYIQVSGNRSFAQSVSTVAFLLEGERLASLIIVFMNLLLPCLLFAGSRRRVTTCAAAIAAMLVVSMPVYAGCVGLQLSDCITALFAEAALFAFFGWVERREARWFILASLLAGFAAGTKWNGLALFPVLFLLAAGVAIRLREAQWQRTMLAVGLVLVVPLPLFWLNIRDFCNPLYPMFMGLLGETPLPDRVISVQERAWWEWLLLPWRMSVSYVSVGPGLLFALPFALLFRRRNACSLLPLLWGGMTFAFMIGAGMALAGGALVHQHYLAAGRYMLFSLPPIALFSGCALGRAMDVSPMHRRVVSAFLGVGLAFAIAVFANGIWGRATAVLRGTPRDDFLAARVPMYDTMLYANRHLPADAYTLIIHTFGYYHERRYAAQLPSVGFVDFRREDSPEGFCRWLRDQGFTHLLVSGIPSFEPAFTQFLERHPEALAPPFFSKEYEGRDGSTLYRRVAP